MPRSGREASPCASCATREAAAWRPKKCFSGTCTILDDDHLKVGKVIHGIPVVGTTAQLAALAQALGVSQALITIASAPGRAIRRITMLCREAGLDTKIIPGLF